MCSGYPVLTCSPNRLRFESGQTQYLVYFIIFALKAVKENRHVLAPKLWTHVTCTNKLGAIVFVLFFMLVVLPEAGAMYDALSDGVPSDGVSDFFIEKNLPSIVSAMKNKT